MTASAETIAELKTKITPKMEKKHQATFDRDARYTGNGYRISNKYAHDTRDLFILYVAGKEGIEFKID